jgi:RNA polymerase subunit RPABC4/transcription elongation factor Spt4
MNYHVRRGLREIVTSAHRLTKQEWAGVLKEFDGRCSYCDSASTVENRGIVADHLIPVTEFGELVAGNTVPACQTCNDSRGNKDWRAFLVSRHPNNAALRIAKIESFIKRHDYSPNSIENSLTAQEQKEYRELEHEWEKLLKKAQALKASVESRRVNRT